MKYDYQFSVEAELGDLSPGITIMAESLGKGSLKVMIEGGGCDCYSVADATKIATAILNVINRAKLAHLKAHGVKWIAP